MTGQGEGFPVHPTVDVHAGNTIYRTDTWWKAAVLHSYDGGEPEIAIYLWHRDEDWSRKNKYHVKTAEAWESDKKLIEQYISNEGQSVESQNDFPVSDYYRVSQGETVFQTDNWWKAVLSIDQKGSYETHEVIIYLWQQVDGDWRRRQKYAIKNLEDWEDDRSAVDSLVESEPTVSTRDTPGETIEGSEEIHSVSRVKQSPGVSVSQSSNDTVERDILETVQAEVKELHLGTEAAEDY
jgi:hypothetical protein